MTAKTPVKGHTSKHVHKASKHHKAKGKHHPAHNPNPVPGFRVVPPHAVGTPAHHPKPRGFAVGDVLPVCAFEAVAQSLRLAGQRVTDDDVAGLWELHGEVSIAEALAAAVRFGLAGFRPAQQRHIGPVDAEALCGKIRVACGELVVDQCEDLIEAASHLSGESFGHALILGVDVPGPHAVLATADGWWSWGELHDPWPCRIEEAWAVSWS